MLVERVMGLIDNCWKRPRDRHEALAGDPFLAMGLVLGRHPSLDVTRLTKILQSKVVSDITQEGNRVAADNPGLSIAGSGLMYHGLLSMYNYRIPAAKKELPVRRQGVPTYEDRVSHPSSKYSDAFILQIAA